MADDGQGSRPSANATRRSSDASTVEHLSIDDHQSRNNSVGNSSLLPDSGRRRAHASQGQPEGYGSITRQTTPPARPKKPANLRRISSQFPHKGQNFSVDDAQDEIDIQLERQKKAAEKAKLSTGSIRSQSTLRRRTTAAVPSLAKVPSAAEEEEEIEPEELSLLGSSVPLGQSGASDSPATDDLLQSESPLDVDEEEDGALSDAESFTLKDRQDAINVTHPFGIRIWKPALYKKNRSVQKTAEEEIHSTPGLHVNPWIAFFNILWTVLFGWWLCALCFGGAVVCFIFGIISGHAVAYGRVFLGLSTYFLYPFGKFVKLLQDEAYAEEDEGEGRSISEYEQWQSGDIEEGRLFFGPMSRSLIGRRRMSIESTDETQSLLGRHRRGERVVPVPNSQKTRLFGRGTWNLGRVIFFFYFHLIVGPFLLGACLLCWFMVFTIPMGKVTWIVWDHLRRHPLALSFHSQSSDTRQPGEPPSSILVCTYRAVGSKYWKFTIDGTNIFLINLLAIVGITIFDFYFLAEYLQLKLFITSQALLFCLALFSIIPLAYFIGQAVASISAQSSMGVGATVNAFFSTIVEVFLYCVALNQGKAQLVEGSVIGSILAGILFLPGLSMCFGALKRKTQRFNVPKYNIIEFRRINKYSVNLYGGGAGLNNLLFGCDARSKR